MEFKEIQKTIDCLEKLKEEKKGEFFNNIAKDIRKELISSLTNAVLHFESNVINKVRDDFPNMDILWDYNTDVILNAIGNINVNVWECE